MSAILSDVVSLYRLLRSTTGGIPGSTSMGGIVVVVVGGAVGSVLGARGFDEAESAESPPPPPQAVSKRADSAVAHAAARTQCLTIELLPATDPSHARSRTGWQARSPTRWHRHSVALKGCLG